MHPFEMKMEQPQDEVCFNNDNDMHDYNNTIA